MDQGGVKATLTDLRRWFHKDHARWPEFRLQYLAELDLNSSVSVVEGIARDGVATLVFANADLEHNHAAVLRDFLIKRMSVAANPETNLTGGTTE
ncbi:DUF488 domain-containing protein [uncultured Tateyamaria sp.]|uniref:DUF488 domain-containing protein n=1 Tax=uncultured Tateyamaria sp. TaxID=455651 RepID=UPI002612030F|nr:DUF488 family protein [uncultured Tateyamaria sp.]